MYMYKGISLPYKKKKKHPNTESQLYFSIKLNKSKKKKKKGTESTSKNIVLRPQELDCYTPAAGVSPGPPG